MRQTWADEYLQMVEDCTNRESKLSEWEVGFIDSITHRIEDGKILTAKQIEKLDAIWERVTRDD